MLAVACLLAVSAGAAEPWYESYAGALEAMAAGQWERAEARLQAAVKDGPRPGRSVRTYGTRFIAFLPGYQLGVVRFRQGRYQEALELFERAEQAGLVRPGDPEHALLTQLRAQATAQLAARAPAPAPSATPTPAARAEAPRVASPPVASPPAPTPAAPPAVVAASPSPAAGAARRAPAAAGSATAPREGDDPERAGIRAFYGGRYEAALAWLEPLAAAPRPSPRSLRYAAYSAAALGLLRGEPGAPLIERARALEAAASRLDPRPDPHARWISPQVREVLQAVP